MENEPREAEGEYNFASCWLVIIILSAFLIRLLAAVCWDVYFAHGGFVYGDSDGYWTLAQNIASGKPYEYYGRQIFRMPGYPLFLAALQAIFGTNVPILYGRIAGAVLGAFCVWETWAIARLLYGDKAGLISASIAAIYPEFVLISPMILSETLFSAFLLAQIYFWVRGFISSRWQDALWMGLFGGLATLVKPGWILFTPGALAALGLYRLWTKETSKKLFLQGVASIAVMFLVLLPWAYRNERISGRWIFTTLQGGPSLMDGLNPDADGSSNMSFMPAVYERFGAKANGQIDNIEQELQVNDYTRRAAWDWATSNPGKVCRLAVIKMIRTWSPFPNQASFSKLPACLAMGVPYILLWIFSIYSLNCSGQKTFFWLLFILTALYICSIQSLFVGSIRYRLPAMWMLCVLASRRKSNRELSEV
ncbi:MAG: glycosyltransferase family 39 protein [Thermoguttaceae bacterium]|nr:glycosyltransferase family 39 protein [Thermoguttaceae bacterium]